MKVKATKMYQEKNVIDGVLGRIPKEGEVFEVDEQRFEVLHGNNGYKVIFVERVEEKPIKEAVAPKPKKETAKKKTTKK